MSFIQADQEFLVETGTTVNNTGEVLWGKQVRIPFLSPIAIRVP